MTFVVGACAAGTLGAIGTGVVTFLSEPPIAGHVLERETHKPVTRASVLLTGTPCGTNTNDQGYFELDCPKLRRISLEKAQVLIKDPETDQWCLGNVLGRLPRSHRFYISRTAHNCSATSEAATQHNLYDDETADGGILPFMDADVEGWSVWDANVDDDDSNVKHGHLAIRIDEFVFPETETNQLFLKVEVWFKNGDSVSYNPPMDKVALAASRRRLIKFNAIYDSYRSDAQDLQDVHDLTRCAISIRGRVGHMNDNLTINATVLVRFRSGYSASCMPKLSKWRGQASENFVVAR
ncbi:hypothetical protein [Sorangium sp. So ce1153]|uniref:hypothetical protein n=1 Tax=Sorangium sp. So ce1153 TaxID=3133333 RepID=UPI003F5EE698